MEGSERLAAVVRMLMWLAVRSGRALERQCVGARGDARRRRGVLSTRLRPLTRASWLRRGSAKHRAAESRVNILQGEERNWRWQSGVLCLTFSHALH